MKYKFEFPAVCGLWVSTVVQVILSVAVHDAFPICICGALMLTSLLLFWYSCSRKDEVVYLLLKPIICMMVFAIVTFSLLTRDPSMFAVVGVQALMLWRIERSYAYELTYES